MVIEVSHTTNSRDAGIKKRLYERSGVQEYLIVRPSKNQLVWRRLVDGKYVEMPPDADRLMRSQIFPGLWLDPAALWNGDLAGISKSVERGVATREHASFVERLERRHQ